MLHLSLMLICTAILILTHGKYEGTFRLSGFGRGLSCFQLGRLRVGVYAFRQNRVYYKLTFAGGQQCH